MELPKVSWLVATPCDPCGWAVQYEKTGEIVEPIAFLPVFADEKTAREVADSTPGNPSATKLTYERRT